MIELPVIGIYRKIRKYQQMTVLLKIALFT